MWTRYKSYYLMYMKGNFQTYHIKAEQSGPPESDCFHKNKKIKTLILKPMIKLFA